jgi:Ca-activated chloride channel family protein
MKRSLLFVVVFALCCTSSRQYEMKPGPIGVIRGTVTSQGAVIPGVTVILTNFNGRTAVTDAQGRFSFIGLPPGVYDVRVMLEGFAPTTRQVMVTREHGIDLVAELQFASVSESITVTAVAPASGWSAVYVAPSSPSYGIAAREPHYAAIEEHGFIDTSKEKVATFAIDVDRASYANVRRHLREGTVPPRDAVRIEEMLNYFRYSYPQPSGDAPFSVTTEVAACPWNLRNRLVRIGIQGRNLEQWRTAPNNLVFLIDVSGSMDSVDKLGLIQQSLRVLVNELRAEDRVAVVVYAGAAGLVLPSTSGADRETILASIDRLQAGGSTNGGAGIELAYAVAAQHFLEHGNNRVILATDGDFNVGVASIAELEKLIEKKRKTGIFLSVLGVGSDNLQDATMEMLADKGNGNYSYLDSLDEAKKVFRDELTGTLVTIAKDVKVQLEFDSAAVASYRQIGYENRALAKEDFDDDAKDAGELGAGHSVTALFEVVPKTAAPARLATVKLRYKEPNGVTSKPLITDVRDEGKSAYEASSDLQFAAAVAELGMLLRDSEHKGTASWDDLLALARQSAGVDLDGTRQEFLQLAETAQRLK